MRRAPLLALLLIACSGGDDDAPLRDAGVRAGDAGSLRDAGPATDRDGGASDRDGGASEGGPEGCFTVDADRTIDFDLVASDPATLRLTMNGAVPPDAPRERGLLRAVHDVWGGGFNGRIMSTTGPIEAPGDLVPGEHTVSFVSAACDPPDDTPYCGGVRAPATLAPGDNVLDVTFGVVDLTFTLDGATFPDAAAPRGRVLFRSLDDDVFVTRGFEVSATGAVGLRTGLFAGSYAVHFESRLECDVACGAAAPTTIEVGAAGVTQTIDLTTALVTGTVRQDGAPIVGGIVGAGFLTFETESSAATTVVGDDGTFAARVLSGTYDVRYVGLDDGPPADRPVNIVAVAEDRSFTADTTLDADLVTADVELVVTANGAPLAGPFDGGGVAVYTADGEQSHYVALDEFMAGRWVRNVIAGRYDVRFFPTADCAFDDALPCAPATIAEDVDLTMDGITMLDVVSHPVRVTLTADGAPLPDAAAPRGTVTFVGADPTLTELTGPGAIDLPAAGPATVATRLPPGRWIVDYRAPFDGSCEAGALGPVPCGPVRVGELDVAGAVDATLDITSFVISGRVTVEGAAIAAPVDAPPRLSFSDAAIGGWSAALDAEGRYAVRVPAGAFGVEYLANGVCAGDVGVPRPCASQSLHACR